MFQQVAPGVKRDLNDKRKRAVSAPF